LIQDEAPEEPSAVCRARHQASAGARVPADNAADPTPPPLLAAQPLTDEQFHQRLRAANPGYAGRAQIQRQQGRIVAVGLREANVSDLSPLRGLPLQLLDLTATQVSDLSPLSGMRLVRLALGGTKVQDLSPLKGMPLTVLDLLQTPVQDLSPLQGIELTELYLDNTQIDSLEALRGMELTKLYINNTAVSDLAPLQGMPLTELNAVGCDIRDLSPLKGMALRMVWQAAQAVSIPICGIGGIATAEDAVKFLLCGATAVQVGTASYLNPMAAGEVAAGIEAWCAAERVAAVRDLVGGLVLP